MRVGIGHDTHRLETGRPLILGGLRIEHPQAGWRATAMPTWCYMPSPMPCWGRPAWAISAMPFLIPIPQYHGMDSSIFVKETLKRLQTGGWRGWSTWT